MISLLGPDSSFNIFSFIGNKLDDVLKIDIATLRSLIFHNRIVAIGDVNGDGSLSKLMVIAAPDVGSPCISLMLLYYTDDEEFVRQALKLCDRHYYQYFSKIKLRSDKSEIPISLVKAGFKQEVCGPNGLNIFSFFLPSYNQSKGASLYKSQ